MQHRALARITLLLIVAGFPLSVVQAAGPVPSQTGPSEPLALLSPQGIVERIQAGERLQFVDVREPEEFAEGHIPGAINIPERDFEARLAEIDHDALVLPYCNMDFRAFLAARKLESLGVPRVALMQERGLNGWRASGLPVAGGDTGVAEAEAQARLRELSPADLLGDRFARRVEATGVRHEIRMTASEWYFEPNDIEVSAGDEVELTIASEKGNHYFVQPDFELGVTLPEGQERKIVFVADRAGDFRFGSCEWDGSSLQVMKGRLRVRAPRE